MNLLSSARRIWRGVASIAGKRRSWEFFFQATQGIAAVVLTAIAIWGVFFTSIPETLIRQYQSEVAQAREEVTSVMRDRQKLLTQVEEAEANLEQAQSKQSEAERAMAEAQTELDKVHNDIALLQTQRDELTKERSAAVAELVDLQQQLRVARELVANALAERDKYLGVALRQAIEQILAALSEQANQLSELLKDAELLRRIPEFAARQKELDDSLKGVSDINEKMDIIQGWYNKYPADKDWTIWQLRDNDPTIEITKLRARIVSTSEVAAPTGATIIEGVLKRESFGYLLDHDWALFKSVVGSLVNSRNSLISSPLRISLKESFSDQDLANEISRTKAAVSDFQKFIALLRDALAAKLSKA